MVSFVISAKEKQKRINYAQNYCEKLQINKIDRTLIEKETGKITTQSIGIEDIKRIQKSIFLKPIKSVTKAVIIEDAQLLTPQAQNALLKVLEEPPAHTIIMLGSETKEALLPTILSRCQIIELEGTSTQLTGKALEELNTFIGNMPTLSTMERLKKAEALAKDKDKAIIWIENLILALRQDLLKFHLGGETATTPRNLAVYPHLISSFQELHKLLKTTNINPRFAIENTLLLH